MKYLTLRLIVCIFVFLSSVAWGQTPDYSRPVSLFENICLNTKRDQEALISKMKTLGAITEPPLNYEINDSKVASYGFSLDNVLVELTFTRTMGDTLVSVGCSILVKSISANDLLPFLSALPELGIPDRSSIPTIIPDTARWLIQNQNETLMVSLSDSFEGKSAQEKNGVIILRSYKK